MTIGTEYTLYVFASDGNEHILGWAEHRQKTDGGSRVTGRTDTLATFPDTKAGQRMADAWSGDNNRREAQRVSR